MNVFFSLFHLVSVSVSFLSTMITVIESSHFLLSVCTGVRFHDGRSII